MTRADGGTSARNSRRFFSEWLLFSTIRTIRTKKGFLLLGEHSWTGLTLANKSRDVFLPKPWIQHENAANYCQIRKLLVFQLPFRDLIRNSPNTQIQKKHSL